MLDSEILDLNEYKEIGGVAVIIEVKKTINDINSKIAFIVENELKEWKNPGQISIPFGTIEKSELPLDTAVRETEEELGLQMDKSLFNEKGEFVMFVNSKKGKIKVNIYIFHILLFNEPNFKNKNNDEIRDILLMNNGDLDKIEADGIRPGTIESLNIISNNNKGVFIQVENGIYKSNI